MPFTLTMPKLSPTMDEGAIAKWHKKEGDHVEAGELLLEVSTDKATVEHNALDSGYLRKILVQEGKNAAVNQPIAIFTETKDDSIQDYIPEDLREKPAQEKEEKVEVTQKKPTSEKETMAKASFVPAPPLEKTPFERKAPSERIFASPLAKRLAEEQSLDIGSVKGTGPRGRIMSQDLKLAQPQIPFRTPHGSPEVAAGTYEEETLSQMRKAIAKRVQEAKTFIPHFYVRISVNAENLVSLREQILQSGLKLTYNDFIIKACSIVLRNHPTINSGYNSQNDTIIRFKTVDISVAVSIEEGLITPIVRYADYKSIGEISAEVKDLATKAKAGKLNPEEYQGGSFTISNMGMFDVEDFQAVINPPQAAILAVGKIHDVPVVKNQQVVPGKKLSLVLSVDHRVIDGVAAAKFLQDLKKVLENPSVLFL